MKGKVLPALLITVILTLLVSCGGDSGSTDNGGGTTGNNSSFDRNNVTMVSAYTEAQRLGFSGTLEQFIDMISGENGVDGNDGVGITDIIVDGDGVLIIWLSDGRAIHCGKVVGADGKDGAPGEDGEDGAPGKDGEDGAPGKDGVDGEDGKDGVDGADGVTPMLKVGEDNYWYVSYDDGATWTCLNVKATGEDGKDGQDGQDGQDGVDGAPGKDGADGEDGVSVVDAYVDDDLHLWIVLSNGTKIDAGYVGVDGDGSNYTTYTVTFVDYNGKVLKTQSVVSGKSATAPNPPQREGFKFIGWDKTFDNITDNLTVTAQYQEITSPTIIVQDAVVNSGEETVSVVISLLNNPGISSMKLIVTYGDELVLQNVTFNSEFGAYVTAPYPYNNPQSITFISPLVEVSASGKFATLTFALPDNISENIEIDVLVSVDQENTYDEKFVDVAFDTVNGKVTIIND